LHQELQFRPVQAQVRFFHQPEELLVRQLATVIFIRFFEPARSIAVRTASKPTKKPPTSMA
jgi:hypothetical protein